MCDPLAASGAIGSGHGHEMAARDMEGLSERGCVHITPRQVSITPGFDKVLDTRQHANNVGN